MQQTTPMAELPAANFSPSETEHLFPEVECIIPELQTVSSSQAKQMAGQIWAYRLLWVTFFFFFASTGAGKLWDRFWHATVRFDTFWSPPHFFVFVMTATSGLLVATIAFTPQLRAWYGPGIRFPFIPFKVPGSLVVLGGGLVALTITIMFDNFWHSTYGLDETQWSVPHCMLGWSWFTIIIGFIAARLAFQNYRPVNWITHLVMALLLLEFLCPAILGPFYLMYSPHLVNALKNIPIVTTEPSAQHMYRIYEHFGLTRQTHPLYIPFAALFAGTALALLRRLNMRKRVFLLAPLLWSVLLMGRDWYTLYFLHYDGIRKITEIGPILLKEPSLWMPIPILIASVLYVLLRHTSFQDNRILIVTGIVFGICTFAIWHTAPWMLLLALPAGATLPLGAWLGNFLYDIIEKPRLETLMRFLLATCAQIPAVLGIVDLFMRRATP
ncbi:hypothetical protein [Dictyobacter arantiisoli]|uniref:Uncharacterized protein n=1 Tax=Dictyobacter arantiisoli TaxID=2014874 RepID=A0A5A5T7K6_9CHLR|nr:hypothetical protein [Dictyobacter arantiisoli]GCF07387.1 hypothetical protein KDI_09510 [Dictyobacter arantiisoli]